MPIMVWHEGLPLLSDQQKPPNPAVWSCSPIVNSAKGGLGNTGGAGFSAGVGVRVEGIGVIVSAGPPQPIPNPNASVRLVTVIADSCFIFQSSGPGEACIQTWLHPYFTVFNTPQSL